MEKAAGWMKKYISVLLKLHCVKTLQPTFLHSKKCCYASTKTNLPQATCLHYHTHLLILCIQKKKRKKVNLQSQSRLSTIVIVTPPGNNKCNETALQRSNMIVKKYQDKNKKRFKKKVSTKKCWHYFCCPRTEIMTHTDENRTCEFSDTYMCVQVDVGLWLWHTCVSVVHLWLTHGFAQDILIPKVYWAAQWSWFAWVNALRKLSLMKSWKVTAATSGPISE